MAPIPKKVLMALSRKKKKEDKEKWEEHLLKERERQKKIYQSKKVTMSEEDLKILRAKTLAKVQKHREKKKQAQRLTASPKKGTYKCRQTFGKAVTKVCSSLPKSPGKRKAVIKEVVKRNFGGICKKLFTNTKSYREKKIEKFAAEAFYCNDDISRQAPGKRDVKAVRNKETGVKEKIPVRHMLMNISDAYYEFKKNNPELKMSLSSFFACRPTFVLPASKTPHNVCVCKKHPLNFSFMVEALHQKFPDFPESYKTLLNEMCCDVSNENCMFNNCKQCKFRSKIFLPEGLNLSINVKWKKWEEVNGFLQVSTKEGSLKFLLEELDKAFLTFKEHCYVKVVQHEYFERVKKEKDGSKAIIQVDIAENATLTDQNQIQSAHWKQRQVTIFTCVIWCADDIKSLAIVSDDLSHSKYAVWTFLKVVGKFIKHHFPLVDQLIFFSDNAASQFRSKYTISNLCYLEDDLDFWTIEWVTFAASHGKGAVDGVGAALKNIMWNRVKSENLTINSAQEYYEQALKSSKSVAIFFVPTEEIKRNEIILNERWEEVVDKITVSTEKDNETPKDKKRKQKKKSKSELGLQSFHFFQKSSDSCVYAARTVQSEMFEIKVFEKTNKEDFNPKERWHYSDIYSDSDDERICEPAAGPSSIVTPHELAVQNISPDTYVLVELKSEVTKKTYYYVGVCQSVVCEDGEILIMFMKMYVEQSKDFYHG